MKDNFKIGDRVINHDSRSMTEGMRGEVVGFHKEQDIVYVKYDDGSYNGFRGEGYSPGSYANLSRLVLICQCHCCGYNSK